MGHYLTANFPDERFSLETTIFTFLPSCAIHRPSVWLICFSNEFFRFSVMNIFSRRHPTLPVEGKIVGLVYCMFKL